MMKTTSVLLLAIGACLWQSARGAITTTQVASSLARPVHITSPPGDFDRLFIVEQHSGRIKILNLGTGTVNATPFLTISGLATGNEQGLLGLAFHPDYATNGYLYVNYTQSGSGATNIRRYTVSGDPNIADPMTASTVMTFSQPFENHNGGWLGFGPNDGYMYIPTGDGGDANDPQNNAQNLVNERLGKLLRIDVNGDEFPADANRNYRIPASNPFFLLGDNNQSGLVDRTDALQMAAGFGEESAATLAQGDHNRDGAVNLDDAHLLKQHFGDMDRGDDEIFAFGLRNPWRAGFDRVTGDLFIGDVGQGAREEIDFLSASSPGGENYGWKIMEGTLCIDSNEPLPCNHSSFTPPIHEYPNPAGMAAAVTGGYVYRGPDAALAGLYFFADHIDGDIWTFRYDGENLTELTEQLPTSFLISSFGEDAAGNLYFSHLSTSNGAIYRINSTPSPEPQGANLPEPPGWLLAAIALGVVMAARRSRALGVVLQAQ